MIFWPLTFTMDMDLYMNLFVGRFVNFSPIIYSEN